MTKDDLIKLVTEKANEAEAFFRDNAPNEQEQDKHYTNGVSVVQMNVNTLQSWFDSVETQGTNIIRDYWALPKEERREVWEASGFHFGVWGYKKHHADFFWQYEQK